MTDFSEFNTNPDVINSTENTASNPIKKERDHLSKMFVDDQTKQGVIDRLSDADIADMLQRHYSKPSFTFETISKHEFITNETPRQRQVREVIENIFENNYLTAFMSPQETGMPDGISMAFDEEGNLVIDKIIESKISEHAATQARQEKQPERTLQTITKIISVINRIVSSGGDISPTLLFRDINYKGYERVSSMIKQINKLHLRSDEQIILSPKLTYEMIIPKKEDKPNHRYKTRLIDGTNTDIYVSESNFSLSDLDKISGKSTVQNPIAPIQ